jgi:type IV pilus assembly protein PilB
MKLLDEAYVAETPYPTASAESGPLHFYAQRGVFDERDAIQLVADRLGLKTVTPAKRGEPTPPLDSSALAKVSLLQWQRLRAIPVDRVGGRLRVAVSNPLDHEIKSTIEFALGAPVEIVMSEESYIDAMLAREVSLENTTSLAPILADVSDLEDLPQGDSSSVAASNDHGAPPVVRIVEQILGDAVAAGASDIHLSPDAKHLQVRIRVDGVLRDLLTVPALYALPVTSRLKLLSGLDIAEKRRPQDGRLRYRSSRATHDLRVSTVPTLHGETIVARILAADFSHVSLGSLGMPEKLRERYERAISGSSRVVLVTGPTGSGKTSTLYASVTRLHDGESNIITIEDPIEYRLAGINQIQVNPRINLSFAEALRSVLRQDPDVVVVGEIRDGETASIAMQTAQTGHLVLSTLHTNTAPGAVTRLRDLGLPAFMIAASLEAVLAQRLVRKLCEACAVPVTDPEELQRFDALQIDPSSARTPKGCPECGGSGYAGRTGVYSFMECSSEIREAIRDGRGEDELAQLAAAHGFLSLEAAARQVVSEGVTSLREAERVIGFLDRVERAHQVTRSRVVPAVATETAKSAPPRAPFARRKLLLVEDDENMRTVLAMIFERAMYEVVQCENGAEALEQIYANIPDIIVSDYMMPQMDGAQLISIVRSRPETKAIPIIILTAIDSEENQLHQLNSGADDFVSKTADHKILLARVEKLVQRAGG